ncbi:MAG: glycerophosphodiester phosphodiesterase [Myxococcota bacterium]
MARRPAAHAREPPPGAPALSAPSPTTATPPPALPARGIGAHRGASQAFPENTLAAFAEAVRLGAAMVELDLRRTADDHIVVLHDKRLERTTDGEGDVGEWTLARLRELDAGSHAGARFAGERIPTLEEVLDWAPPDVWLNLQIKAREPLGQRVARALAARGLEKGAFIACGNSAARDAHTVNPGVPICALARQASRALYVDHAVRLGAHWIQLHHLRGLPEPELVERAHAAGLKVIYFADPAAPAAAAAWAAGVDFLLVDDVAGALRAVPEAARIS